MSCCLGEQDINMQSFNPFLKKGLHSSNILPTFIMGGQWGQRNSGEMNMAGIIIIFFCTYALNPESYLARWSLLLF